MQKQWEPVNSCATGRRMENMKLKVFCFEYETTEHLLLLFCVILCNISVRNHHLTWITCFQFIQVHQQWKVISVEIVWCGLYIYYVLIIASCHRLSCDLLCCPMHRVHIKYLWTESTNNGKSIVRVQLLSIVCWFYRSPLGLILFQITVICQ